jgi:hypothetical protein
LKELFALLNFICPEIVVDYVVFFCIRMRQRRRRKSRRVRKSSFVMVGTLLIHSYFKDILCAGRIRPSKYPGPLVTRD